MPWVSGLTLKRPWILKHLKRVRRLEIVWNLLREPMRRTIEAGLKWLLLVAELTASVRQHIDGLWSKSLKWHWIIDLWKWLFKAYCCETIILQYAIVTHRAGVQPIGYRLGPGLRLTSMPRPNLPFNGLHLRNPCKLHRLLIYRHRRDGRLSWPSWLTHSGRLTHEVLDSRRKNPNLRPSETAV